MRNRGITTHLQINWLDVYYCRDGKYSHNIHEHQVNPEIQRVTRIQIRTPSQPLWTESHPTPIQLSSAEYDDPIMPSRVVGDELFEDVTAEGSRAEDCEDFEGYDCFVRETPAKICTGIFFPWVSVGLLAGLPGEANVLT